jgi:hypothetical protein
MPAQRLPLPRHRFQPLTELRYLRRRAIVGQIHREHRDEPVHIGLGACIQALPLDAGHGIALGERLEDRDAAFRQCLFLGQLVDRAAPAGFLRRARPR